MFNIFYGCIGLTSVTIPSSVTIIDGDAFFGCSGLTSLTIDNGVTSIGRGAFSNCTGLTSVTIPESVTGISSYAFQDCTGLTSVTIDNSVARIVDYAFQGCSSLTSITLGNNVTSIGGEVFMNTGWYNSQSNGILYLDNWLIGYKGTRPSGDLIINDGTKGIAGSAFSGCSSLTSVLIPNSVTSICDAVFYNCSGLTSIEIPNNVMRIGDDAFYGCSGLTSVTVDIETPLTIYNRTFSNRSNATLYVPTGCKAAYEAADYWKNFKQIEEYSPNINFKSMAAKALCVQNWDTNNDGELSKAEAAAVTNLEDVFSESNITSFDELQYFTGLTYINYSAFYNCSLLTSITIPNSVTRILGDAFYDCTGLTAVHISDLAAWCNITNNSNPLNYAHHLYLNGEEVKDLVIPNSVTSIGGSAFQGCSGLTSVTIPESVTSIGSNAFENCTGLTAVHISDLAAWCNITNNSSPLNYAHHLYLNGEEVKDLVIPNSVTTIGAHAFEGCSGLTSVAIPNSVTSIGGSAFYSCSGLTSIIVEEGNANYDSRDNCNAIIETATNKLISGCKNTIIPEGITTIGGWSFSFCSELASINIPNGVTRIEMAAFENCYALSSVTIPSSVTIIEGYAFSYCCNLPSVTIPNSVTNIGEMAFNNCHNFTSIAIPNSVTSIGGSAFFNCNNLTTVIVDIDSPLTIDENTFSNRSNATLYVPAGTTAAYEAADYWKEFGSIVEISLQLTKYHKWDGCSATATVTEEDGRGEINLGTPLQGYNLLYGRNDVIYLYYADLTGYESLTIEGTPGMLLRVLLNRQEPVEGGDPNGGAFTELNPTIGDDGKVTVSFSDYEFVHLNAIKLNGSPSGTITSLTLTEKGQEEPVDPNNMLYAEEKTGRSGASVIIPVMLKTEQFYAGANFSVTLPEGFTLTKVKEEDLLTDHNITFQKTGEKTWTIFVYSTQRSQFSAKEGALLKLKVGVDNDIETGTYAMRLSNIVVSDLNLSENNLANSNSQIIINNSFGKLGDATNDGRRNVTDIMAVINYIFKIPVNNFNEIAADVNGDGDVNVTDIMGIVNLAFEEAAQNAQNSRALRYDYKTIEPE